MTACGKDYCRACEASEGRPEALDQFIADAIRESQGPVVTVRFRLLLVLVAAWVVVVISLWLWLYA